MLGRRGLDSTGLVALGSILVFSQVVLLFVVVLRVLESVPRLEPVKVYSEVQKSVLTDRRVRTVQLPPAKEESDETTDHVP